MDEINNIKPIWEQVEDAKLRNPQVPRPVGIAIRQTSVAIPTACGAPRFRNFPPSTCPQIAPISPILPIFKKILSSLIPKYITPKEKTYFSLRPPP